MSGQSANLSISEAKRMQERTVCGNNSQGPKKSSGSTGSVEVLTKKGK